MSLVNQVGTLEKEYGRDVRIQSLKVRKVLTKYRMRGFGPRGVSIFADTGDAVLALNGTVTTISGFIEEIEITPAFERLIIRKEVLGESGVVLLKVSGG